MASNDPDLSVVMPVFNEGEIVGGVIADWADVLTGLGIEYEFLVYDAESTDGTIDAIRGLAESNERIKLHVCPALPHGPSILKGYREARGQWVFQMDSDAEMPPDAFPGLWDHRDVYDFLLGCRQDRTSPLARRIVTLVSRLSVWSLFGRGVLDVNSPYRLIRRDTLTKLIDGMPDDTIAPNVILSGLAGKKGLRIYQCDVPHYSRRVGTAPLTRLSLWKVAAKAFQQTLSAAFRA